MRIVSESIWNDDPLMGNARCRRRPQRRRGIPCHRRRRLCNSNDPRVVIVVVLLPPLESPTLIFLTIIAMSTAVRLAKTPDSVIAWLAVIAQAEDDDGVDDASSRANPRSLTSSSSSSSSSSLSTDATMASPPSTSKLSPPQWP